jgi:NADH-quinone oxidoreductase subunit J
MVVSILFYVFASMAVFASAMVVFSKNPVNSVLFLILAFFNAAGLFVLLGAEFLAMLLIIVYVGAVAVLFMFVVMMLDIDYASLRQGVQKYLPIGIVIGGILMIEMILVGGTWHFSEGMNEVLASKTPILSDVANTQAIGNILYTDYIFLFQLAGLILLVAMIGAIILTHRTREGVKKQRIHDQVRRQRDDAFEAIDVKPGEGI